MARVLGHDQEFKAGILTCIHDLGTKQPAPMATLITRNFQMFDDQKVSPALSIAPAKGYSHPNIRRWFRYRHMAPVIPAHKDQPGEPSFEIKGGYRKVNHIEIAVRHFKERRALGIRCEKPAVGYLAL